MRTWEKKDNIKKANLILETNYLWGQKIKTLSEDHIRYVLGIELPLNESYYGNPELIQRIIQEQMLYENFLDTVKNFAKEKINQVVNTIQNWKDAAAVLFNVLKDPKLLDNFLKPLARRFDAAMQPILNKLKSSGQIGQGIIKSIESMLQKIEALEPWKKLFAYIAFGSIALFISKNISKEGMINQLMSMITNYFSDNFFKDLLASFVGWTAFTKFMSTIKGISNVIFDFLQELIQKFSSAIDAQKKGDMWATAIIK